MLISFIIPHYNLEKCLLQRCIGSILGQNIAVEDYEVLIVDDGSYAPPMWVEEEYSQANIKLLTAKHGGPGAARNKGIDEARGEYIQFVDADDSLVPDSIGYCIKLLKEEKPDILQHSYRICHTDEQMQESPKASTKIKKYASGAEYVSRNNLGGSPWAYIFKRALANSHGINFAENVMHEDEDFNIKIYYYGKKLLVCENIVYNYFQRENSITYNNHPLHEEKRINDFFKLLKRVVKFRFDRQEECTMTERAALDRKLAMLTVDTLLNLFYNGKSAEEIAKICRNELYSLGLYPLPKKNYSTKYRIFALLANNSTGLKLIRKILPSHKPGKK
jgi:glycosyltransferase involved in cell wall biosynthesis